MLNVDTTVFLVKEFMVAMGQEVKKRPALPTPEVRKLRAELILEEALETITALGFQVKPDFSLVENAFTEPSLVEIADGLADLHYVGYCGTALACGLNMSPIFDEVHKSNMSKLWTKDEITDDIRRMNVSIKFIPELNRYIVLNEMGKVLKPVSFKAPAVYEEIHTQLAKV